MNVNSMTRAIVEAHRDAVALPSESLHDGVFTSDDPTYRAAKTACQQLGFIDADAQCVASAWQLQTVRTGAFDANHWPDEPIDFGMDPRPRSNAFPACLKQLGLYAVLPDAAWVARMAQAGVPTVQLRFKSDDQHAVDREVKAAVKAVKGTHSLLFINDHWQAAIDTGAYGVHLGQEDMADMGVAPLETIRQAGLRLGLSSHGYAEMMKADAFSPSYIAMGAVYATTLKRMVTPPQGPGRLRAYARLMRDYPLVAIGGIDEARMPDVLASGVGSVAVVRALVGADQPQAVASKLSLLIATALQGKLNRAGSPKAA
jgi:thiamine-phosphate pyrophosphorylase